MKYICTNCQRVDLNVPEDTTHCLGCGEEISDLTCTECGMRGLDHVHEEGRCCMCSGDLDALMAKVSLMASIFGIVVRPATPEEAGQIIERMNPGLRN